MSEPGRDSTGRDSAGQARASPRADLDAAVDMGQENALTTDDDPGIDATTDSAETDLNPDDYPATPDLEPAY